LHVSEACLCVQDLIPYLSQYSVGLVNVVTGSGHHTMGPQQGHARILPAVMQVCDELGLKYNEVVDKNGFVGGLKIKLIKP
jgi:hypothetical protein